MEQLRYLDQLGRKQHISVVGPFAGPRWCVINHFTYFTFLMAR